MIEAENPYEEKQLKGLRAAACEVARNYRNGNNSDWRAALAAMHPAQAAAVAILVGRYLTLGEYEGFMKSVVKGAL